MLPSLKRVNPNLKVISAYRKKNPTNRNHTDVWWFVDLSKELDHLWKPMRHQWMKKEWILIPWKSDTKASPLVLQNWTCWANDKNSAQRVWAILENIQGFAELLFRYLTNQDPFAFPESMNFSRRKAMCSLVVSSARPHYTKHISGTESWRTKFSPSTSHKFISAAY